ncbi:transcriptional repressor, LexA family [Syntrophotalea carbinolica DSM 2380]|uniref:LexA repressor n=1 Tax=Syntrophotalea carbinolica (strain DSM 2380 / NBRC 103641 / GraBd1) TaxID=338963 RepID=LEXA_SYNC1|nr:transcriptional repressor LexA [Syntrophotalea carbinolica]Q3A3S5.1 RecName: Full=LexA repressor [Syntrophotalea carbinolica DSM 2380]ABA88982.1 transcriptional repressor, LexA family [Syntrophotalea carbinolica DSM 2380]
MSPLTPKQKQVFDYIARHIGEQGFAPSQQEIARAFGFRSLGTVRNYLVRLEREGLLERNWNARRGLQLRTASERGMKLPLAGTVAAGKPIEAIEIPDVIEVPPTMVGSGEHFVLRVAGDSMIGDGIIDGDYVVVRKQATAEHGQTVVALLDNEATVKRLHRRNDRIELHPANPSMQPIVVTDPDNFRIEGVVVGVIRHYRSA